MRRPHRGTRSFALRCLWRAVAAHGLGTVTGTARVGLQRSHERIMPTALHRARIVRPGRRAGDAGATNGKAQRQRIHLSVGPIRTRNAARACCTSPIPAKKAAGQVGVRYAKRKLVDPCIEARPRLSPQHSLVGDLFAGHAPRTIVQSASRQCLTPRARRPLAMSHNCTDRRRQAKIIVVCQHPDISTEIARATVPVAH